MRKAVAKTIFVLSAVFFLGGIPINASASEVSPSCESIGEFIPLVSSLHPIPREVALYHPLQQSFFQRQSSSSILSDTKLSTRMYAAEIGESDVEDVDNALTTPELLVQEVSPAVELPPIVPVVQSTETPLDADKLFTMVNDTRASFGLSPFQREERVCSVVVSRAPELYNEIVVSHTMHAGFFARNLPYFATENLIHMRTEEEALNWWMNSPVHRSAILGEYTYACSACVGKSCGMIFTNFEPKAHAMPAPTTTK